MKIKRRVKKNDRNLINNIANRSLLLLVVLLIIVIILGIKLIITLDKVNNIVDNLKEKVDALNGMFKIVNFASEKINYFSTKVIDTVVSFVNKIFGLSGKDDDEDYE